MNSHQGLLTAVERDLLGGDANFPTGFKVLTALRNALDDPHAPVDRVTRLVGAEPLVVSRLLRLANCFTFNPRGVEVLTVASAIQRVGFNTVRSAAAAVAIAQMRSNGSGHAFTDLADAAWLRSVQLSAVAQLLAPKHPGVSADEAALCGLVSELGTFYLLQRAARYPTYVDPSQRALLSDLLARHSPAMSARLAAQLGLPEAVVAVLEALRKQAERPHAGLALFDLVVEAAEARKSIFPAPEQASPADLAPPSAPAAGAAALAPAFEDLAQQAHASLQDLLAALEAR